MASVLHWLSELQCSGGYGQHSAEDRAAPKHRSGLAPELFMLSWQREAYALQSNEPEERREDWHYRLAAISWSGQQTVTLERERTVLFDSAPCRL